MFFEDQRIIDLSHDFFIELLSTGNGVKMPKELKAYFKKSGMSAINISEAWTINSFEMFLINEAIKQNIFDKTKLNVSFEKIVNKCKKQISTINTNEKIKSISNIYESFYMEIYHDILEISRFCLITSIYLESGIITEEEVFAPKRFFKNYDKNFKESEKINPKKLN